MQNPILESDEENEIVEYTEIVCTVFDISRIHFIGFKKAAKKRFFFFFASRQTYCTVYV